MGLDQSKAGQHAEESLGEHRSNHSTAIGAEGHTDSNFIGPLRNGICGDA